MILGQVLDLMVRMLGFSNEDKQRIGVAQQGPGKGVVRGVLGLPGRLVGGILGGSGSTESAANVGVDNQVHFFTSCICYPWGLLRKRSAEKNMIRTLGELHKSLLL